MGTKLKMFTGVKYSLAYKVKDIVSLIWTRALRHTKNQENMSHMKEIQSTAKNREMKEIPESTGNYTVVIILN